MDWQTMVKDLRGTAGMKLREIGEVIDCTASTLSDIESGRTESPSFRIGEALNALHKREMRKAARRLK